MKKEKLLVVSQYFYPEQFRINDMCKEWVTRGKDVTVVTGIPNYPKGKYFEGYGLLKNRKENYNGVEVIRIPLIARGKRTLGMICNYLSFVVSGLFWSRFTKIEADRVFIFEVSPMTQALVGVWYAKRKRIPCTIYVQDLWPENVEVVTGIHNPQILGAISWMSDYIYRNCDRVLATSPSFVKRLEERDSTRNLDGSSKVVYWPQYAEEFYRPMKKVPLSDLPENKSFRIAFTGNIGYAQGLDLLPRVALELKKSDQQCEFVIIGDGRYEEELMQEITKTETTAFFRMLGRKKPEEIPLYLAHCDVAYISFAENELFNMTIPAKLQSYMACGMPILAVAGGETARIVVEAGAGVVAERNACSVARLISELKTSDLADYRENSRVYAEVNFDRNKLLDQVEGLMDEKYIKNSK